LAGGATEQLAGSAAGGLALAGWPPPSRHGCQAPQRCPQQHGWWPSARPLGVVAQEVRMPAVPSSPCRCPRPASGVRCGRPASTRACPRDAVQCPVRASGRPGVRRPAWASGVRAIPRPRCPTGMRSWTGGGGQAAAWPGGPGSAWSPRCSRPARRLPGSEPGGRGWRRPCWASGGIGLDLAVVVAGGWAVAGSPAWPTRIGRMRARIARWQVSRGAQRGSDYAPWSSCEARLSRLVAASPPGWTATCACGRAAAATCSERRPLAAGDALTCDVGGGGEGI